MRRCPVNVLAVPYISRFIPYFFEWKNSGVYPDAQGRLLQPVKLLEAFSLCNVIAREREEKAAKNGK
jgi:hypothetical protein